MPAVAGGVAGVGGAELARVGAHDLGDQLGAHRAAGDDLGDGGDRLDLLARGVTGRRRVLTHASWPFISETGAAARAAAATARAISSRCEKMGRRSI